MGMYCRSLIESESRTSSARASSSMPADSKITNNMSEKIVQDDNSDEGVHCSSDFTASTENGTDQRSARSGRRSFPIEKTVTRSMSRSMVASSTTPQTRSKSVVKSRASEPRPTTSRTSTKIDSNQKSSKRRGRPSISSHTKSKSPSISTDEQAASSSSLKRKSSITSVTKIDSQPVNCSPRQSSFQFKRILLTTSDSSEDDSPSSNCSSNIKSKSYRQWHSSTPIRPKSNKPPIARVESSDDEQAPDKMDKAQSANIANKSATTRIDPSPTTTIEQVNRGSVSHHADLSDADDEASSQMAPMANIDLQPNLLLPSTSQTDFSAVPKLNGLTSRQIVASRLPAAQSRSKQISPSLEPSQTVDAGRYQFGKNSAKLNGVDSRGCPNGSISSTEHRRTSLPVVVRSGSHRSVLMDGVQQANLPASSNCIGVDSHQSANKLEQFEQCLHQYQDRNLFFDMEYQKKSLKALLEKMIQDKACLVAKWMLKQVIEEFGFAPNADLAQPLVRIDSHQQPSLNFFFAASSSCDNNVVMTRELKNVDDEFLLLSKTIYGIVYGMYEMLDTQLALTNH